MMQKFLAFLKFNNAVPIGISFLLLGATGTYAANNPEQILSEEQEVISIDNTYIASKNFNNYTPSVEIISVNEDSDFYYVLYEFSTIELTDHVWQDVVKEREMKIAKTTLGNFRDLGEFVTKQLRELIANEIARLKETQVFEKKKVTQKKVTTKYKGIVGGFLDAKTDTIAGYKPVVKLKEPEPEAQTFARPDPNAKKKVPAVPIAVPVPVQEEQVPEPEVQEVIEEVPPVDEVVEVNKPPKLTILGDGHVRVPLGESYTDLGVVVEDDQVAELSVDVFLDGVSVPSIVIDTSIVKTYEITYEATDQEGLIGQKTRTVEVYDPSVENGGGADGGGGGNSTGTTTEPEPLQDPIATSTPEDESEEVEPTPPEDIPGDDGATPPVEAAEPQEQSQEQQQEQPQNTSEQSVNEESGEIETPELLGGGS